MTVTYYALSKNLLNIFLMIVNQTITESFACNCSQYTHLSQIWINYRLLVLIKTLQLATVVAILILSYSINLDLSEKCSLLFRCCFLLLQLWQRSICVLSTAFSSSPTPLKIHLYIQQWRTWRIKLEILLNLMWIIIKIFNRCFALCTFHNKHLEINCILKIHIIHYIFFAKIKNPSPKSPGWM